MCGHTEYESGAQHSERADVVDPFIRINLVEGCTKFGRQDRDQPEGNRDHGPAISRIYAPSKRSTYRVDTRTSSCTTARTLEDQ